MITFWLKFNAFICYIVIFVYLDRSCRYFYSFSLDKLDKVLYACPCAHGYKLEWNTWCHVVKQLFDFTICKFLQLLLQFFGRAGPGKPDPPLGAWTSINFSPRRESGAGSWILQGVGYRDGDCKTCPCSAPLHDYLLCKSQIHQDINLVLQNAPFKHILSVIW